jgi:hypothetical protein
MTKQIQEQEKKNKNKTSSAWKKYLMGAVIGSMISFGGIQTYNRLHNPEALRVSEVERKAGEIYETLRCNGFLEYNLDGKKVTGTLITWSGGRYGGFIGHSMKLDNGEGVIFNSRRIRGIPREAARTLESIEVRVSDGRREYKIKEVPEKKQFQDKYDSLIEQIYLEKMKGDSQAKNLLDNQRR